MHIYPPRVGTYEIVLLEDTYKIYWEHEGFKSCEGENCRWCALGMRPKPKLYIKAMVDGVEFDELRLFTKQQVEFVKKVRSDYHSLNRAKILCIGDGKRGVFKELEERPKQLVFGGLFGDKP